MTATAMIRRAHASDVQPWRHAWLRPHQPLHMACFPGDDEGIHLIAEIPDGTGHRIVGIGTALADMTPALNAYRPQKPFRLRGMATHPEHRSAGIGGTLLAKMINTLRNAQCDLVWCNARVPASRFYLVNGFQKIGDEYDIPGIGPHYCMVQSLTDSGPRATPK